jgi:hypothetical protein
MVNLAEVVVGLVERNDRGGRLRQAKAGRKEKAVNNTHGAPLFGAGARKQCQPEILYSVLYYLLQFFIDGRHFHQRH